MKTRKELERKLRRKNRKQGTLYVFCNFISLMLITAYSAMMVSPTVQNVFPQGGDSRKQMTMVFVLAVAGCIVFTIYASSLFFRQKSRQMGILMALGASRKKLAPGLLAEVGILSVVSAGAGILAGVPFDMLIWGIFCLFVSTEEMELSFAPDFLIFSLAFLALVVACACLMAFRYLRKTNIMDVVHEEHKNEPVKELGGWCGPVGILLTVVGAAAGYFAPSIYMNIAQKYSPAWVNLAYAPAFAGVYLVMLHTVVHGWGRHKKNPYKNIIARSMMKFQGRQTVNSLLVITALMAGGFFASFYMPTLLTGMSAQTSSWSYDYWMSYPSQKEILPQKEVQELADSYQVSLKDWKELEYVILAMDGTSQKEREDGSFYYEYKELLMEGRFLSESSFREFTGKEIDVKPGTYQPVSNDEETGTYYAYAGSSVLTSLPGEKKLSTSFGGYAHENMFAGHIAYYVLDDQEYAAITSEVGEEWKGCIRAFRADNDSYEFAAALYEKYIKCFSWEEGISFAYDKVRAYTAAKEGITYDSAYYYVDLSKPDSMDTRSSWTYMPKFRVLSERDNFKTYGVFLMMFLFISIICFVAGVIICYTRCRTIAMINRYIFEDLKKLGAPPRFLRREVENQCKKIFQIPCLAGALLMYLFFFMILFVNDNKVTSSEIRALGVCLFILIAMSVMVYAVYYGVVRKILQELQIYSVKKHRR